MGLYSLSCTTPIQKSCEVLKLWDFAPIDTTVYFEYFYFEYNWCYVSNFQAFASLPKWGSAEFYCQNSSTLSATWSVKCSEIGFEPHGNQLLAGRWLASRVNGTMMRIARSQRTSVPTMWKVVIRSQCRWCQSRNGTSLKEIGWVLEIKWQWHCGYINGLVQERRNSIAWAIELRLSCTNPSTCTSTSTWCC